MASHDPFGGKLTAASPETKIGQNVQTGIDEMKSVLSPKELGAAIGVSESSLKRWADSGRLDVARTAGGHRRIELSEAIRFVRSQGFSLERPGILGLEDIDAASSGPETDDPAAALHDALSNGEAERARGLALARYVEGMPLALIIDRMIAPAMRAIGDRWQHGEDGIMIEHRAADICGQILDRVRSLGVVGPDRCSAVGGSPADDPYVLPSLMAASVLASEGWKEANLSANTPATVLASAAVEAEADLVWVAFSTEDGAERARQVTGDLRAALADAGLEASIVIGGPALNAVTSINLTGVYHARSMTELAAFAQGLRATRAARPATAGNQHA
jgi:methanogenic corrinoid protein MtbC1